MPLKRRRRKRMSKALDAFDEAEELYEDLMAEQEG